MMFSKDFGQEFGEDREMSAELHEKTPGVYVRAENELPHELDMLWSHTRPYQREERSPLLTFVAGALAGAILTTAVFLLFFIRPNISTDENNAMLAPLAEDFQAEPAAPVLAAPVTSPSKPAAKASSQPAVSMPANVRSYTVVSGDTLSGIAYKMYGSSDPKYIDKIQRANNMSTPDSLQLDQKLVIPPKDY
jgi:hypothetical protein